MDDISHQEGKAFAALQIGHTVVHHNLPCVDNGVSVGGVGRSPPSQVDPASTCCSPIGRGEPGPGLSPGPVLTC